MILMSFHIIKKKVQINLMDLLDFYNIIKTARPDSSQNFMHTAKTMDLTSLCIQINKTVAIFQSNTHQTNLSTVNRKYTMFTE